MYRTTLSPDLIDRLDLDGAVTTIPRGHGLWGEYQAWLDEGNTPIPSPATGNPSPRQQLTTTIATTRYQRETAGTTIELAGATVPVLTEREAIAVLTSAIVAGESLGNWPTGWKFADNVFRPVTPDDLRAAALACHAHVQAAFAWEAGELARLAATPDESLDRFEIGNAQS
ncbi:DUF4376 domain-containing protein [Chitiniphilus shinanonensis]|uniref:DUF4376 domain-containing protein n=1 Tax=Chitiniphilus shinanonensis TaxID=553088 RepID=UPI00303B6997